jgi:hypothetical protein
VRAQVGIAVLALLQLYWVWAFLVHYVHAPIRLYRRDVVRRDATRTLDPRYPEPIDIDLLRWLEASESRLAELGFGEPHRTTTMSTYPITVASSSMEHAEHGDPVIVTGAMRTRGVAAGVFSGAMAFDSDFADGVRLVTSNARNLRYFPDPRDTDHVRLSEITELDELYRFHRARVERRAQRVPQKRISRGRTPEQRLVWAKRRHLDFLKHLVRCGYARRTPGGVRPTVRGALFGAWRHVLPWRAVDQWWLRRRARAVLRLG